jgi:hypothetical protein
VAFGVGKIPILEPEEVYSQRLSAAFMIGRAIEEGYFFDE